MDRKEKVFEKWYIAEPRSNNNARGTSLSTTLRVYADSVLESQNVHSSITSPDVELTRTPSFSQDQVRLSVQPYRMKYDEEDAGSHELLSPKEYDNLSPKFESYSGQKVPSNYMRRPETLIPAAHTEFPSYQPLFDDLEWRIKGAQQKREDLSKWLTPGANKAGKGVPRPRIAILDSGIEGNPWFKTPKRRRFSKRWRKAFTVIRATRAFRRAVTKENIDPCPDKRIMRKRWRKALTVVQATTAFRRAIHVANEDVESDFCVTVPDPPKQSPETQSPSPGIRSAAFQAASGRDSDAESEVASIFSDGGESASSTSTSPNPVQKIGIREIVLALLSQPEFKELCGITIRTVEPQKARKHLRGFLKRYGRDLLRDLSNMSPESQAAKFIHQLAGRIADAIILRIAGKLEEMDHSPEAEPVRRNLELWLATLRSQVEASGDHSMPKEPGIPTSIHDILEEDSPDVKHEDSLPLPNIEQIVDFLLNSEAFSALITSMRTWLELHGGNGRQYDKPKDKKSSPGRNRPKHIEETNASKRITRETSPGSDRLSQLFPSRPSPNAFASTNGPSSRHTSYPLALKPATQLPNQISRAPALPSFSEETVSSFSPLDCQSSSPMSDGSFSKGLFDRLSSQEWMSRAEKYDKLEGKKRTIGQTITEIDEFVNDKKLRRRVEAEFAAEYERLARLEPQLFGGMSSVTKVPVTPPRSKEIAHGVVEKMCMDTQESELNRRVTEPNKRSPTEHQLHRDVSADTTRFVRETRNILYLLSGLLDYWGVLSWFGDFLELFIPHVRPGYNRHWWQCSCNTLLWGDFPVDQDEGVNQLMRELSSRPPYSSRQPSGSTSRQGGHAGTGDLGVRHPASTDIGASLSNVGGVQPGGFNSPDSTHLPLSSRPHVINIDLSPQYFEVCVNIGNHAIDHHEIDISRVTTDGELFQLIWNKYNSSRGKGLRRLFLQPKDVHFVMFSVSRASQYGAGIHKKPDEFPPKEEIDANRYHYLYPKVSMPVNWFLHYLHRARWNIWGEHTEDIWLRRLPKKLKESVLADAGQQGGQAALTDPKLAFGWGVHILDGPNHAGICLLLIIGVCIAFAVAILIVGIARTSEEGFSVGNFLLTILGLCTASVYFRLQDQ